MKILRKCYNVISIIITICSMLLSSQAFGGPIAYGACVTTCELACAGGLAITAGTTLPVYLACAATCPTNCAWSVVFCFASDTVVTVLENGDEVDKNVSAVQANDLVKTLNSNGEHVWTRVLKNSKIEGVGEFIAINAQNQNNTQSVIKLKVTPLHGIVMNSDGKRTIDTAENLLVGDSLYGSNGDVLSVISVDKIKMQDEYVLETEFGTVLASGMLVSATDNKKFSGGEKLFDS